MFWSLDLMAEWGQNQDGGSDTRNQRIHGQRNLIYEDCRFSRDRSAWKAADDMCLRRLVLNPPALRMLPQALGALFVGHTSSNPGPRIVDR
jgi:hypothetical protein